MEEVEFKIQDIFQILKSRWKMVATITAAITLCTALLSFFVIKPVYEVNTKVFIGKEESNRTEYNNGDVVMYLNLLETYSELIKTNDLIENAINEKNLDITPKEVVEGLVITPKTDTQILQISYHNMNDVLAKEVVVAVVDEFIKESKKLIPNGTVIVIENAELPEFPISPNKGRDVTIACFLGIIIGSVIALFLEYMDDTFKTKEQTEKIIGIPVIGMIPCEESSTSRKNKHVKKSYKNLNESICNN